MSEDRCPDCGASGVGGPAGCQALFEEFTGRAFSDPRYGATHQLVVDAYSLQHPEPYCHSAKSYAAHLTRLCCGLEHGGDPKVYAAIPKWLNGSLPIEKPEAPGDRGRMTVAGLRAARNVEEQAKLARDWAKCVWEAYAAQQEIARNWIQAALGQNTIRR